MSMQKDYGGEAFPGDGQWGLSKRDWFATAALPLAWEVEKTTPSMSTHAQPTYAGAATRAYLMADAMLEARKK